MRLSKVFPASNVQTGWGWGGCRRRRWGCGGGCGWRRWGGGWWW
ncbi:hypothetical protein [Streptosporangium sp. NPDC000396]